MANILWREFSKNDMKKRDANKRECDRNRRHDGVRMNASERKKRLQHLGEILFAEIAQRETRERDTKLGRRKGMQSRCARMYLVILARCVPSLLMYRS